MYRNRMQEVRFRAIKAWAKELEEKTPNMATPIFDHGRWLIDHTNMQIELTSLLFELIGP